MKAIVRGDLVTGRGTGDGDGHEIPPDLTGFDNARLRFNGQAVVDAEGFSTFHIDENGLRHIVPTQQAWQSLDCAWDDELVREANGTWRVADDDDKLAALKAELKREIDRDAERERLRYITPGDGQAAVYLAKAEEVQRFAGDGSPDPADYPLLAASIGIDGEDLAAVAAVVAATRQQWLGLAAMIESARATAKAAIDAAGDEDGARGARKLVAWPAV